MQSKTFNLFETVLHVLAQKYNKSYSLEDLTAIVSCISIDQYFDKVAIVAIDEERENQAEVLEALIRLNDIGLSF
jgi:hypothetical protein